MIKSAPDCCHASIKILSVFAIASIFTGAISYAEDKSPPQSHAEMPGEHEKGRMLENDEAGKD